MARGTEDFGTPTYTFGIHNVDANEIQQMLLGFGLIDGLGHTVFYDDFNEGLHKWTVLPTGTNVYPSLHVHEADNLQVAYRSPYALEMVTTTAAFETQEITQYMYLGTIHRVGLEVGLFIRPNSPNLRIYGIHTDLAGNNKDAQILIDVKNTKIFLYQAGVAINLSSYVPNLFDISRKVRLKIVWDIDKSKYVRFMIGDIDIPVTAYTIDNSVGSAIGNFGCSIIAEATNISVGKAYIGYVRLTKDEP